MRRNGICGECLLTTLQVSNLPASILHDPNLLRRKIRTARRALSRQEQRAHSRAISRILTSLNLYRNSQRIALYIDTDGAVDTSDLLSTASKHGKRRYLPVLRSPLKHSLWFAEYMQRDRLLCNRFGIEEPDPGKRHPIQPWGLDLIVAPLVAFDASGNRLGMGGGFYDRTFAYLRHRSIWCRPKLIGIAHELQKVECPRPEKWDIPLDGVVTEARFYRPKPPDIPNQL